MTPERAVSEAVRSAILATAWLLVDTKHLQLDAITVSDSHCHSTNRTTKAMKGSQVTDPVNMNIK